MNITFSTKIILIVILIVAAFFRLYNVNWDQGYHLHPDERAIIMTIEKLSLPTSFENFLSVNSPWNPHFFAYGSFPFYLLYFVGQILSPLDPQFATYALLNIPGRILSAISDLFTLVVLFLIGKKLFNEKVGLIASFLYAISVLPIQLSHFYAVDTLLTFFITITLYQLILFYENPSIKRAMFIGLLFGLALATKISAIVFAVSIGTSLLIDFILIFLRNPHKPQHWISHVSIFLKHFLLYASLIIIATCITFLFFSPYVLIDFKNFWLQTIQQEAMTKDAFTFPYTLQYVNKIPFLYELKNIFFFGLGPIISILSTIGFMSLFFLIKKKIKKNKWVQEIILLSFFFSYFITVGSFAIGFMRYMLPLYPMFCLFAAIAFFLFLSYLKKLSQNLFIIISCILIVILFIWPISFIQIYSHYNTRVDATEWILQNIPSGKTILVEHWDDRLPLVNSEQFLIEDLELYNPDTSDKWQKIEDQLSRADYLIIASNRLYTPLQKLTDCSNLPLFRCYQQTANYYEKLFSGQLGFYKIAEFTQSPTIPLLNVKINDETADESFTVYDHPKVMIFKKFGL